MSTVYKGVNATNVAASIPKLAEEGQQGGVRKTLYDKFVLTADLAAGDSIKIGGLLPVGAQIMSATLACEALGGSCTVDVGWDASADAVEAQNKTGLFAAAVVSAAAVQTLTATTGTAAAFGYTFSAQVQPTIWEHAVSSGGTGKAISLAIEYLET